MMRKHVTRFVTHPLIAGSTVVIIGANIANFFNWIFNTLILGRFFLPADYGVYAALISFFAIFGIFPSAFTTIFAKFAAMYKVRKEENSISIVFTYGLRIVFIFAAIILAILCVTVLFSASFLHIQDLRLLFLVFFTIFLSIIASLPNGILQGEMRFILLSFLTSSTPLFKILIGLFLLLLGMKIFGVVLAIFIASLLPLIIIYSIFWRKYGKGEISKSSQTLFLKEFKDYSFQSFLAIVGVTILSSADVILVKHFFTPEKAGQYAALSLMGKSIFYLTSPIYFVFFPLIAQKREKKENIYNTLLLGIGVITLCSVSLSFIYFLFPTNILNIFFPLEGYKVLASFLGPFSLYIIVFSIAMLLNNFLLSIGKTGVYKINLFVSTLYVFLLSVFHTSFYHIIAVLFVTSFLLLLLYLLYYLFGKDEKK